MQEYRRVHNTDRLVKELNAIRCLVHAWTERLQIIQPPDELVTEGFLQKVPDAH